MDDLMTQIGTMTAGIGIFIFITMIGSFIFSIWMFKYIRRSFFSNTKVLDHGILAQATILKAWQTGTMVNYNPQIGFRLQIQPSNGAAYEVETKAVVSQLHLAQLQEGSVVPVKIDPQDQTQVALVLR